MATRFSTVILPLLATCASALVSYPPIPEDLNTPFQQRLAVAGPNAISIGWNTYQHLRLPCVKYGLQKSALTSETCSFSSVTYPTSRTWFNTVVLLDLLPFRQYFFEIQSDNSTIGHFISPRAAGDKTPYNMNVVIDLGVVGKDGYTIQMNQTKRDTIPSIDPSLNHTTIQRLAQTLDDFEFIIHPGDFAYADDWYLRPKNLLDGVDAYEAILEQFYGQLEPIAQRKPYMASPGNHEADCTEIPLLNGACPDGQKNFTDFMVRFGLTMPTAFPSSSPFITAQIAANTSRNLAKPPFWYSFEYGLAHIVMINTETDFPNAPDGRGTALNSGPFGGRNQQLEFLEADLASVDRSITPWLIVGGHRPWYSTGNSSSHNVCAPCQAAFEPLLYKYGVDVAIFGHVHNSQRFVPTYNHMIDPRGLNDPKAPVYIVAGGAGNIEGLDAVGDRPSNTAFAFADDFSYAQIQFESESYLTIEFIRSMTGEILDSSTLFKSHETRFVRQ